MKARARRPGAFIVSRCLESMMKHEARVFDMASQTVPPSPKMNNANIGCCLKFLVGVSACINAFVKDGCVSCRNPRGPFS